jgi:hypothetical protein
MLAQSSHLGHLRRLARLEPGRRNGSGTLRQKGFKGVKPPKFVAQVNGRERLVQPSDKNASYCMPVDELVIVDETGEDHHVQLFRGMSADDLRRKIRKLAIVQKGEYRLSCADDAWDEFTALSKTVLSPSQTEELPATEPGIHRVRGRIEFQFTIDYYRALAKIALHYYLVYNACGFRGSESHFREIRAFIRRGEGDCNLFFRPPSVEFVTRFGETMSGRVVLPGRWCHVLAVSELNNTITVCLQVYLGPENLPKPIYVRLAEIQSRIVFPHRDWGHVYQIEPGREDKYDGRILIPMIRAVASSG